MMKHRLGPRLLVVVASIGLAVAVGFVFAPVAQTSFSYSFSPLGGDDATSVVAPLAIARSEPDTLEVRLSCTRSGSEFSSGRTSEATRIVAASSQRSPVRFGPLEAGIHLEVSTTEVAAWLGPEALFATAIDPLTPCEARLSYESGVWELDVQGRSSTVSAAGPRFSEAAFGGPAASDAATRVTVTTREIGSSPSVLQVALFSMALVLTILAMWTVSEPATGRESRDTLTPGRWLRRFVIPISVLDLVVVSGLLAWLVLLPPQFDEGWVRGIVESYSGLGEFSVLYVNGAVASPLGYWLRWVQSAWLTVAGNPLLMRLLPLLLGIGVWRWLRGVACVHRVPGVGGSVWMMGAVYLLGFGTFGMTLRSEPVVMALMMASYAIAVRFRDAPSSGLVAVWGLVVALALTSHPSGIVVLAPVLAGGPTLWMWVRDEANRIAGLVIGLGSVSLLLLLLFVDSGVRQKAESIGAFRVDGQHGFGVFDEYRRYEVLRLHGPTMHRLVVVLMVATALAFVLRRWGRGVDLGQPAITLIIGLALLTLTPSKWFWHFGGLVPIASLAAAIEFRALRGWRRVAVLGALIPALAWVWSDGIPWAALDLRTQRWWPGATNFLPVDLSSPVVWGGLSLVVWVAWYLIRRQITDPHWNPVEGTVLVAAGLVIAVTGATLVLDVARTEGWTYGRQSLRAASGTADCGLGEELRLPVPGALDPAEAATWGTATDPYDMPAMSVRALLDDGDFSIMVTPELLQYFPCVGPPRLEGGVVEKPDVMILTPVVAWQTTFVSAASSDDYYRFPAPIPPNGDDGSIVILVSQEYLTGVAARATDRFTVEVSG